jgi:flagellar biosynthesis protein FlhF
MRVKRFTGDNVADTMSKIKRELGPDAVILQTRQIKEGGFLGFFARTKVEITAAIEERPLGTKAVGIMDEFRQSVNTDVIKKAYEAYRDKENEYAKEKSVKELSSGQIVAEKNFLESTQSEIREIHSMLKEINRQITKGKGEIQEDIPSLLTAGRISCWTGVLVLSLPVIF